ncbi:MAG: hypothetical protein WBC31_14085 [Candidatus Phosphoribacter baldrii]
MTATGLEVRVHEGRERAEAVRVARTLTEVVGSLHEIDRIHLLRGTRATWVLADMEREAHDLVIRLEARLVPTGRDMADMLVPVLALVDGAETLQHEAEVPRLFAPNTVTRLGRLAEPRDGVQSVTLATYNGSPGKPVVLSDAVRENAAQAVRSFEVAYGSVSGTLSALRDTRTKGTVKVTVRTAARQAVDGHVPESLADQLRELWRHRVMLGGKVRRNSRGQAIRIDVDTVERLPEGNEGRPSTDSLLGAAADWLDDLTVDEFVGRLRG